VSRAARRHTGQDEQQDEQQHDQGGRLTQCRAGHSGTGRGGVHRTSTVTVTVVSLMSSVRTVIRSCQRPEMGIGAVAR